MFEYILVYGIMILIFVMIIYIAVGSLRFDKRMNERFNMRRPTIENTKSDFLDLENEIEDLRLEYDRAKKFKKLTNEKEILEKAINEIYREKDRPLDTSDFIKGIEENRKKLYFNIPTKEE